MNWDKIEQLLNIADKARQWPHLSRIHDAVMKELQSINPAEAPTPRAPTTQVERKA